MGKGYSKSYSSSKSAAKRAKQQAAAAASASPATTKDQLAAAAALAGASVAKETCEMMLRLGSLVHQLQKERGSSAIFTGSGGKEYGSELQLLRVMADKSLDELADFCSHITSGPESRVILDYLAQLQRTDFSQIKTPSPYNQSPRPDASAMDADCALPAFSPLEPFTRMRHVLSALRQAIDCGELGDYSRVAKHYAAMIEALSMVIVYLQADFQHLALGPAIAAYVSLMNLKEAVGMERAIVGGMLAGKTERFTASSYSDLLINHGQQAAFAKAFRLNTPRSVMTRYKELCLPQGKEGRELDALLLQYKQAGQARPLTDLVPRLSAKGWFDLMTQRLDNFVVIESLLANHILELGHTADELSVSPDSLCLMDEGSYHGANTEIGLHLNHSDVIDVRELDVKQEIGRGTTGSTYLSLWRNTKVAVKVIQVHKSAAEDELLLRDFGREVSVLKKAHHPNICQFLGCAIDPPTYCVVLEFMQGGSLFEAMRKKQDIDFFVIAGDVACGMEFLHTRMQLMHRDLKSPNILMDMSGRAKLADFGLTCLEQPEGEKTAEIGTYRWMAPEVINHEEYGKPADVYSYGMVLYELLTRELPFVGMSPMKVAMSVATTGLRPTLPEDTPPKLAELITACWARDPLKRPPFAVVQQRLQTLQNTLTAEQKAHIKVIGLRASHLQGVRPNRSSTSNSTGDSHGREGGEGGRHDTRNSGSSNGMRSAGGSRNPTDCREGLLASNPVLAMQQKEKDKEKDKDKGDKESMFATHPPPPVRNMS